MRRSDSGSNTLGLNITADNKHDPCSSRILEAIENKFEAKETAVRVRPATLVDRTALAVADHFCKSMISVANACYSLARS